MQPPSEPRRPRRRWGILLRLVVAVAVPTLVLFGAFAVVAHEVAKRELETELGKRLRAVAAAGAEQIRDAAYLRELGPGDEDDIAHLRAERELSRMARATGVTRLYLFDSRYRSIADSSGKVAIGTIYFQAELDRVELERMFQDGRPKSSVLFEGEDGRLYKAAYAPVKDEDGNVVLAVGVDAPAAFFARLSPLRRNLFLAGTILVAILGVVAVLIARRITRPIRILTDAAEGIARGDLTTAIDVRANDEIAILAATMDEMRSELRARDERNQMMLAGIAHEVRNPLGGIELFTGILRDELPEGDERREHVDRIARELAYLERVVEEFLDYARRPPPELANVDLADVAGEVAMLTAADAEGAGVSVTVEAGTAPVRGDEAQLRRALINLVRNAIAAASGHEGAGVRIVTGCRADRAFAAVENSGPPIPADVRERMFEPFYTRREKGTGLGLAFVQEIVGDHGGEIVVTSEPGTDTRFEISLARHSDA